MEKTGCRNFTWSVCSEGPDERSKTSDLSCLVRSTKAIAHLSRDSPIIDTSAIFSKFDTHLFEKRVPPSLLRTVIVGLGACWKASVREKEKESGVVGGGCWWWEAEAHSAKTRMGICAGHRCWGSVLCLALISCVAWQPVAAQESGRWRYGTISWTRIGDPMTSTRVQINVER